MSTIQTRHIFRIDLAHAPLEARLDSPLTHQDAQADTFTAILRQGMVPLDLTGMTVKGFLTLERQKITLPLEGEAHGCEASLTLASACYALPGPFTLTMQLHAGDVRHTVLHLRGCIARSAAGTIADPADVIPTLAELLGEIDQMRGATQEARAAAEEANEAREGIDGQLEAFRSDLYTPIAVHWEQGGLQSATGTQNSLTTRCRTRYLPAGLLQDVQAAEGFTAGVYAYDGALTYLGTSGFAEHHAVRDVLAAFPGTAHLRINLKALDEHALTPEEAAQSIVITGTEASLLAGRLDRIRELLDGLFTPIPLETGGLNSADGAENSSITRLRTGLIPADEVALARCDSNYQCLFMAYDADGGYLGTTPWQRGPITRGSIAEAYPGAACVRLLLRATFDRTLDPEEVSADPGVILLRSSVQEALSAQQEAIDSRHGALQARQEALQAQQEALTEETEKAHAAIAEEIAAIVEDTIRAQKELADRIAEITNDGSRAHTLLEEKIVSATDGAAKARAVIEARVAAAEAKAAQEHAALDAKIDDAAADAASTDQVLTSMLAATAAQISKASKSDGVTASLSLYDRIGIVGASWDSGYIYTSHTKVIEQERLSWPYMLAMRCGNTSCNYSYHGLGTYDWLAHANGGVKMLADDPCDLYVCTLGGNDMRKRGLSYLGSIEDITSHSTPEEYGRTFYGNYGRIIESIRSHAPKARILLIFWYWPELHTTEEVNRKQYHEALQVLAEHYGIPYINWADDAWYNTVSDNQLGNHPTAVQLSGMTYSFERLYSAAVDRCYRYFCHYPEPAPAYVPLESTLESAVWLADTGNGYSTPAAGTEMLVRLNGGVTGLFATEGQGNPLRELDVDTMTLTGNRSVYYPLPVPTYAKMLCVEAPEGCQVRVFTSILKSGTWYSLKMYDWGSHVQYIDLSHELADGVAINLRNGSADQVRVWFE